MGKSPIEEHKRRAKIGRPQSPHLSIYSFVTQSPRRLSAALGKGGEVTNAHEEEGQ